MVVVFRRIMLVTAFLIAVFIFLAGFYAGFLIDDLRIDDADGLIFDSQLDTDSFLVEKDFFEIFAEKDCDILMRRMQILGDNLGNIGNTLARYDARSLSQGKEYERLRRKYFLLEIRAYTLRKQMNDVCPDEPSNVVLFFYDTKNNQDSLNQGYVLDTLVKGGSNLIVFSLDRDFNESSISTIIDYYDITTVPTMILNFENKFEGYMPTGVLRQHLRKNDTDEQA